MAGCDDLLWTTLSQIIGFSSRSVNIKLPPFPSSKTSIFKMGRFLFILFDSQQASISIHLITSLAMSFMILDSASSFASSILSDCRSTINRFWQHHTLLLYLAQHLLCCYHPHICHIDTWRKRQTKKNWIKARMPRRKQKKIILGLTVV